MREYQDNYNGITIVYGDFYRLIKEAYSFWIQENQMLTTYNTEDEIWEKTTSKAPSSLVLCEILKELCIDNDLKLIKIGPNILSVKEVCDCLDDYLDLEKILYLGKDCRLKNNSQILPFAKALGMNKEMI